MAEQQRLTFIRKERKDRFQINGNNFNFDLLSFWQLTTSNLVSHATRGIIAGYVVPRGLGLREIEANARTRGQHPIALKLLEKRYSGSITYTALHKAVKNVMENHLHDKTFDGIAQTAGSCSTLCYTGQIQLTAEVQ